MRAQPATVRAAAALAVAVLLAACERAHDYATPDAARAAGVFAQRLLPDVLPPSAALIRVERDEVPSGWFHFSSGDYAALAARLAPLDRLPEDPALRAWVQRKDLAGYQAFTVRDGSAAWLLLCAQSKGRCVVRRLG